MYYFYKVYEGLQELVQELFQFGKEVDEGLLEAVSIT